MQDKQKSIGLIVNIALLVFGILLLVQGGYFFTWNIREQWRLYNQINFMLWVLDYNKCFSLMFEVIVGLPLLIINLIAIRYTIIRYYLEGKED